MTLKEIRDYEMRLLRMCPEAEAVTMGSNGGIFITAPKWPEDGTLVEAKVRQLPAREVIGIAPGGTKVVLSDLELT